MLENITNIRDFSTSELSLSLGVIIFIVTMVFILLPSVIIMYRNIMSQRKKRAKKKLLTQILLQKELEDEVEKELEIEQKNDVIW